MATGLIALLDDVAAIAKIAAASLDDAAAQASKAGAKAAGIVIDDAAVTPRYVVGFAADRELPIIWKIAVGSLKNKLLFLLPGALLMSFFIPWAITPLLMLGGAYLCYEGYEKVAEMVGWSEGHGHGEEAASAAATPEELENEKVASAVRTDFILSAEIMAISLAAVASAPIWLQGGVLAVVGLGMTALVYGAVAIIVKMDDWGAALARTGKSPMKEIGAGIVRGMPTFLFWLSKVGMVAMLWVGGSILIHGLHGLGWHWPEETIYGIAEAASKPLAAIEGFAKWFVKSAIDAVIGLIVGAIAAPIMHRFVLPMIAKIGKKDGAAAKAH